VLPGLALQAQVRFLVEGDPRGLQALCQRLPGFAVEVHAEVRHGDRLAVETTVVRGQCLAVGGDVRDQVVSEKVEVLVRGVVAALRTPEHVPVETARLVEVAHGKGQVELRNAGHGDHAHDSTPGRGWHASKMFCQNRFQASMLRW
jgi:hypothetical protein